MGKGDLLPVLDSVGIFQQPREPALHPHLSGTCSKESPHVLRISLSAVPAPVLGGASLVVSTVAQAGPFSMILGLVRPLPSFTSSEGLLQLPAAT